MDTEPFEKFNDLPDDIQYEILAGHPRNIRNARELSTNLRKKALWRKIEQDILSIPKPDEVRWYLTEKRPDNVYFGYCAEMPSEEESVYYDSGEVEYYDSERVEYFEVVRYERDSINDGRYREIRTDTVIVNDPYGVTVSTGSKRYLKGRSVSAKDLSNVGTSKLSPYQFTEIAQIPEDKVLQTLVIYDLMLMSYILEKRLRDFGLTELEVNREENKYIKIYLQNVVEKFDNRYQVGIFLLANAQIFSLESREHPLYSSDLAFYRIQDTDTTDVVLKKIGAMNEKLYNGILVEIDRMFNLNLIYDEF